MSDPRFRSRSPLRDRPRVSGTCAICLEDMSSVPDAKPWFCINRKCTIVAHDKCVLSDRDASGRMQTLGRRGCPVCTTTLREAIVYFMSTSEPAPHGAWCASCWCPIPHNTPMMRCSAPRSHCLAVYHPRCRPLHKCPSCENDITEGLNIRTRAA